MLTVIFRMLQKKSKHFDRNFTSKIHLLRYVLEKKGGLSTLGNGKVMNASCCLLPTL